MKWLASVSELVEASTAEQATNELLKVITDTISEDEAQKIQTQTGFELEGYHRVIDNYAIKHTLKNHGNAQSEALRGQIAVENDDFEKIAEITAQYKSLTHEGKNDTGRETLKFMADIEDIQYTYMEEIRPKRKELALNTLYKHKKPSE